MEELGSKRAKGCGAYLTVMTDEKATDNNERMNKYLISCPGGGSIDHVLRLRP